MHGFWPCFCCIMESFFISHIAHIGIGGLWHNLLIMMLKYIFCPFSTSPLGIIVLGLGDAVIQHHKLLYDWVATFMSTKTNIIWDGIAFQWQRWMPSIKRATIPNLNKASGYGIIIVQKSYLDGEQCLQISSSRSFFLAFTITARRTTSSKLLKLISQSTKRMFRDVDLDSILTELYYNSIAPLHRVFD